MSDKELVEKMERVWSSIGELCATFTEQEWKTPTDCPFLGSIGVRPG